MTIRRLALLSILFVLVLALPSAARANLLVGASYAQATTEDNVGNFHFEDDTNAWKVFGGFRFIRFLGVEASYVDLGSPEDSGSGVSWRAETQAWNAFAVGVLPIGPVEIFGKWGIVGLDSEVDIEGVFGDVDSSTTDTDMCYGIGAAFVFGGHFGVRVEYEQFEAGDIDDLYMYSAGLEFRF
jgi:hypothetical protein